MKNIWEEIEKCDSTSVFRGRKVYFKYVIYKDKSFELLNVVYYIYTNISILVFAQEAEAGPAPTETVGQLLQEYH